MVSQPAGDSLKELRETLETVLESRGTLGKIRAQLRSEIFSTLKEGRDNAPSPPKENVIINELIREYFEFNGYHHSLSTFTAETGTPEERPFSREVLQQEIGIQTTLEEEPLPLIYKLVPCRGLGGDRVSSAMAGRREGA
ncbi:conserved hypothetical protein [Perkinsus marinus ATCC 50983]|uniref:FGFR1 oncogene partner (FOP) N-terminal dimerisation domain-containing protein n=1 Tax=Perkinsus marinus (strain ATCC 50983 / TXsc) TaxID=423536 RepID=C5L4Q2_PERM5|nr:conserved hypothetical protein [Perkinsus marinus ATCC 50983]EER08290.1 conserved hypothetical protein [Perkinsus marinus ATCC 50983]|eukprot:XP_002776474.1 conserved hypothetical protein [Perkinsus marinus ATCC 50983]